MAKSKQAKAREFSEKARREIADRDFGQCIFCRMQYHMEKASWFDLSTLSIMHYIPRAKGGLGIPQNGAVGCQHHHHMLDNGNEGRREEMLGIFKRYLQQHYENWDESKLVYNKWNF